MAKQARRPVNRKPVVPRSNKNKVTKTTNNSQRHVGLDNTLSSENSSGMLSPDISLSISSDYSHGSASSPMSPALDNYQEYGSPLFGAQQRDQILLGDLEEEEVEEESLGRDFPIVSNTGNSSSLKGLYSTKSQHGVPASVITHTPGLINSGVILDAIQGNIPTESPLHSKNKPNSSKVRDGKKLQDTSCPSMHSVTSILSSHVNRNNLKDENKKINELTLNKDPMFSPPHGLGNEVKSQSNGLSSARLHSPPMTMDAILSPTQRSWSAVVTNTSPASSSFTSPLNSLKLDCPDWFHHPFPHRRCPHTSHPIPLLEVYLHLTELHTYSSHLT